MSRMADIMTSLSSKTLRSKLTLSERAELLIDIICDGLGWDTYDVLSEDGKWLEYDVAGAMSDLEAYDVFIDKKKI